MTHAPKILVGKSEGREHSGDLNVKGEDNIKIDLKK
jgi:hypothetical protein